VGEWVQEGRREHTIDGAIAIDHVHGAPCGSGAFVPLASCCSLASFFCCVVLEIGCGGVSFGVLRIAVDVARPDEPLACHVSSLWSTTTVAVAVVVAVGVVDGGGVGVLVVGGGGE
jgi:hypothetical protein